MLTLKTKIIPWLLLAAVAGAGVASYRSPRAHWRIGLWIAKITGRLPDATWGDLAAATLPQRIPVGSSLSALSVSPGIRDTGPCPLLWETRSGSFWGRSEDEPALRIALKNLVIEEVYFHYPTTVRSGDVVLDGGSHLGTFTRFALDRNARLIVAFEPDPVSGAGFKKTFRQEIERGRVILIEEALWNQPGRLTFSNGESSVNGTVTQSVGRAENPRSIDIPATTIDETIQRLKLDRVDYIKLNIEGSERQALEGARHTLVRFKPRILVALDHHPDDPEVIPRIVLETVPEYQVRMRGRDQACFY
jgi:FkbM family methyltransferase